VKVYKTIDDEPYPFKAQRDFKTLQKLKAHGIPCATPFEIHDSLVISEWIGDSRKNTLAELRHGAPDAAKIFEEIIDGITKMYHEAGIVHGKLNEDHIVRSSGKCWFINFSQAVDKFDFEAKTKLRNDCDSIVKFFRQFGLQRDTEKLFQKILSNNFHKGKRK
jgi:serine/threonine-protein kinase RIO1